MGRAALFAGVVFVLAFAAGGTSRSDVVSDAPMAPTTAVPEPTTQAPVQNAPEPSARHQPFTQYFVGPAPWDKSPKPLWHYEDLTPAEKVVVDRGRDTTGWSNINNAFASASEQRAKQAASSSAAAQLGLDNTSLETGVVP